MSGQEVTIYNPQCGELSIDLAKQYKVSAELFEQTILATCVSGNISREEFTAFLIVAREHNLNPLKKEIYAFPKKGGGIVPIVSIDGWMNLINSHPQFDGMDFEEVHEEKNLISCTCTIHRKDRRHPIRVTEYFEECVRDTIPWKMKHRMLRHKAAIQGARYAFGFAGIYDEDEGRVIADSAPMLAPPVPPPPSEIDDSGVLVRKVEAPKKRQERAYVQEPKIIVQEPPAPPNEEPPPPPEYDGDQSPIYDNEPPEPDESEFPEDALAARVDEAKDETDWWQEGYRAREQDIKFNAYPAGMEPLALEKWRDGWKEAFNKGKKK